MFKIILMKNRN